MLTVTKPSLQTLKSPLFMLLFSAVFLGTLGDQLVTNNVEKIVSSRDGLSNMIWFWGFVSLVSAILLPMISAFLGSLILVRQSSTATTVISGETQTIQAIPQSYGLRPFTENHIELLTIETMRAWGKSFLWSFVFIFPGIWKFFAYTLVPYVVLFSKKYSEGQVDALDYSQQICKQNWKAINLWLTVFYFVVPVMSYLLFDSFRLLDQTPVMATVVIFIRTSLEIVFHYQMLKILIHFINQTELASLSAKEPAASQVT